jgi:branched-chain amino acid transport system ATP-binding protein
VSVLETQNLRKSFGALTATQDVSLRFESGIRYAMIGPNGAGKTTLFNLLSGSLRPNYGKILLNDVDITSHSQEERAQIGIARSFQRNNLFPELTVRENLGIACGIKAGLMPTFWRSFRGFHSAHACADNVAAKVGLLDELDRPARHMSYGSQRQLEVGLALACEPTVLLLDEPTSGMSYEETRRMHDLINALPRALTVIVIEHDMDIVLSFADRIIVLDYGRVLEQGNPAEIQASSIVRERYLGQGGFAGADAVVRP